MHDGAADEADAAPAEEPVVKEEKPHPADEDAEADGDITMRAEDHEETVEEAEGTNTAVVTENEADVEDAAEPEEEPVAEEEEVAVEVEVEGE